MVVDEWIFYSLFYMLISCSNLFFHTYISRIKSKTIYTNFIAIRSKLHLCCVSKHRNKSISSTAGVKLIYSSNALQKYYAANTIQFEYYVSSKNYSLVDLFAVLYSEYHCDSSAIEFVRSRGYIILVLITCAIVCLQ